MARPFPGHAWHRKSDAELIYILKDASDAASAAHSIDSLESELKYLDQVHEASTILQYRRQAVKRAAEVAATLVTG
jgi:hypothetical protein